MELRVKEFHADFGEASALGSGGACTESELARINAYALEPLTREQVYVRRMRLCNDQYDRAGERFPLGYLERFRDTLPGKSLLGSHDKRALPLGRFFQADLESEGGVTYLVPAFYLIRSEENAAMRRQIDAGVWNHVSIGFRFADLRCDLCGKSYYDLGACEHVIGQVYDGKEATATYGGDLRKVEAVEGSIVYLGCQYGSVMVKSDRGLFIPADPAAEKRSRGLRLDREETRMELKEPARLMAELDRARAELDEARRAAETQAARVSDLQRELEAREEFATDGKLYRQDLRREIGRLAGILGAGKEAQFILEALEQAPCARLKELAAEYEQRVEEKFPPRGQAAPAAAPPAPQERAPRAHAVL